MTADLSTAEILCGAKTTLERNGWFQGDLYDTTQAVIGKPWNECRVSLLGALCITAGGDLDDCSDRLVESWDAVLSALELREPDFDGLVGDWNDIPGRTLAEVYALLDAAIELAEAGGPQ